MQSWETVRLRIYYRATLLTTTVIFAELCARSQDSECSRCGATSVRPHGRSSAHWRTLYCSLPDTRKPRDQMLSCPGHVNWIRMRTRYIPGGTSCCSTCLPSTDATI